MYKINKIILVIGFIFILGACSTTTDNIETQEQKNLENCISDAESLGEQAASLGDRLASLDVDLADIIDDARSYVVRGRVFLDRCGKYDPETAAEFYRTLTLIEETINMTEYQ